MILIFNDGKRSSDRYLVNKFLENKIDHLIINRITIGSKCLTLGGNFLSISFNNIYDLSNELKKNNVQYIYFSSPITEVVENNDHKFSYYLKNDIDCLFKFVGYSLNKFPKLGSYNSQWFHSNKFINNKVAEQVGFEIPETFIKSDLDTFNGDEKLICKTTSFPVNVYQENKTFIDPGSFMFNIKKYKKNSFFPAHFQNFIVSAVEFRIIFIDGEIFGVKQIPIIKTEIVDIRKQFHNGNVKLEKVIINKKLGKMIREFFYQIDLNFGQIDLLKKDDKYFFLDLNPTGRFEWLDCFCGVNINEQIFITIQKYINELKKY